MWSEEWFAEGEFAAKWESPLKEGAGSTEDLV